MIISASAAKTVLAGAALAAYVFLAASESQRQIRLQAYRFQLELWRIKQEIAVREFLHGDSEKMDIVPAPKWRG